MTKVEAIKALMNDNGGVASWNLIYDNIEKYYPSIKNSPEWEAGIRGVLYRELRNKQNFKKVGFGVFALEDYQQETTVEKIKKDKVRMHSYMEGVMIELGNYDHFATYCADPSAQYQGGISLGQLMTVKDFPSFTYPEIVSVAKRIDVIWFSKDGYQYPKRVVEVIDSIGTLESSLSRAYQLKEFQTNFFLLAPADYVERIKNTLKREPYSLTPKRFIVKNYDETLKFYQTRVALEEVKF